MYNLLLLNTNINDCSTLGHPLSVIFRSEDKDELITKITKLILEGYKKDRLLIMKDINFNVDLNVSINEE